MSGTYVVWPPPANVGAVNIVASGSAATAIAFSIGTLDGQAPTAQGASVSSSSIFMQSATASVPGLVDTIAQAFGGQKTFVVSPIISAFSGTQLAPVFVNASNSFSIGSVSLTNQVLGNLPLSQTQGSLSLITQISGVLPLANTSNIPLNSQTTGSISLTNQVVGILPQANMAPTPINPGGNSTGSISLTTQVSGILPLANTSTIPIQSGGQSSGSISLTTQVVGVLPLANTSNIPLNSQTTGSISLTNQVVGILPQGNLTLTPTFTQATLGSVSVTSSAGGAAYSISLPGSQGAANTTLINNGAGLLSWQPPSAPTAPTIQRFLSTGAQSGLLFTVGSASANVGATYTNSSNTFTVLSAIPTIGSGSIFLFTSGSGVVNGTTLTRVTGSGDSTITFSASQVLATYTTPTSPAPLYIKIKLVGGGGGGAGAGTTINAGANGSNSSFAFFVTGAGYGSPGLAGGNGGVVFGSGSANILSFIGQRGATLGESSANAVEWGGGSGGSSTYFGGGGVTGGPNTSGGSGIANTGGGGAGGGTQLVSGTESGGGGGSGAYIETLITTPSSTYTYSIGGGGPGGSAGTSGAAGGSGAFGILLVEEHYQ